MMVIDQKPKGERRMKEVLDKLVRTLVIQYLDACGQDKPDFSKALETFIEFLIRYQTYKTKEKTTSKIRKGYKARSK